MYRNSTLFAFIALAASCFLSTASATVYTDNGTSATYNLNSGDSLSIASGTFTGTISGFATGAKIAVQSGAVFQPSSFPFPNIHGTLYVYGTFKMTSQLRSNTSFTVKNYGVIWVSSTTLMSGSSQLWTNYYGGLIKFDGDVSMTNDNSIYNQGTVTFGANLTMTGTTSITNRNVITVAGNYLNSGGTFTNLGKFQTTGSITFNNGLAIINNYCRMIAEGGINNTTGYVNNYGFMWAKASAGHGDLVNSGTITNGPNGIIKSVTLNNTGTISGAGYLYFTGNTVTTNMGTTGVTGNTTDTIKFYDVSRTSPSTLYDDQRGILNPNVVYRVFSAPDSTGISNINTCAVEYVAQIPLPLKWNYFFVSLSDNIPSLTWSAQYDAGTMLEVERSIDGSNFIMIKSFAAEKEKSEYQFDDESLDIKTNFIYYRIKAIEPAGSQKFSETRVVKFISQPVAALAVTPNPFINSFTIYYRSEAKGTLCIRVFDVAGREKMHNNSKVGVGLNNIAITKIAGLAAGIYLVQVSRDNKIIAAQKIIKQ